MKRIEHLLWVNGDAAAMLDGLAEMGGLATTTPLGGGARRGPSEGGQAFETWIEHSANASGFEAEPIDLRHGELETALEVAPPAVFMVGQKLLATIRRRGRGRVEVLAPDGARVAVPIAVIRDLLAAPRETQAAIELDGLLSRLPERRRASIRKHLVREHLMKEFVGPAWMLRPLPEDAFAGARRQMAGWLAVLLTLRALEVSTLLVRWWLIGKGALEGSFDSGWLGAFALLFCTQSVIDLTVEKIQGECGIQLATRLQRKLLAGVSLMSTDALRSEGTGSLLGRTIEADALGEFALTGGIAMVLSVVDLLAPPILLFAGGRGHAIAVAFVAALAGVVVMSLRYVAVRRRWTAERLSLTADLVQRMVGHRTELVQGTRADVRDTLDRAHLGYLNCSRDFDRSTLMLTTAHRAWMFLGSIGLGIAFLRHASVPDLAIVLGGLLYGQQAFQTVAAGVLTLGGARIAWERVRLFFAATRDRVASLVLASESAPERDRRPALEARDVVYNYRDEGRPVLEGATLAIRDGDRLLLEGPSGAGKSTLAALLAGIRLPTGGLVLAGGLDLRTLGESGWRRRVVLAPQFHDNHVFAETMAFNLLMGRRWPPVQKDMEEANDVCQALGLGPLLEKMPAGLSQMIGDTGWQLSHGERSRVFLGRALLQGADVVILDESFGPLDPHTLKTCLLAVIERVPTLVVIAHP